MLESQSGAKDGLKNPRTFLYSSLLQTLDILVSSTIIAPCVIGYWRGTWEVVGHLLLPHSTFWSAVASFLIGVAGHLVFTFNQKCLQRFFHPDKYRLTYYFASRLYTAVFGIVCVNMWRGAWILCDQLTGSNILLAVVIVTLIAVVVLALTRTLRNLIAAPFAVSVDRCDGYFHVNTMFKIAGFDEPGLFLLDGIYSVLVVGTLVVIAWRGVWGVFDLTLYPTSKPLSAWGSMILGYGITFFIFIIQPIVRWICDHSNSLFRIILSDIFIFISFIGTVNAWRGIWMLLDVYLVPDNKLVSGLITHISCFLVLTALNCSNSILVRGVYIDAEEDSGDCVVFPIYYIRLYFERERRKKHNRLHHFKENAKIYEMVTTKGVDSCTEKLFVNSKITVQK